MAKSSRPEKLFREGEKRIPSGVNSPVRAFRSVGGTPVFVRKAKGPFLWDETGKKYLDFCASWGPMLFGHAPSGLVKTLRREIPKGTSYGTATAKEIKLAEAIYFFFPSMEKIRLVCSGTEAVMSAIRLARGFTGREKIVKINGGYHGHADSLLVKAGSGLATFGVPGSAGVPETLAALTISIPFNDAEAVEEVFKREGGQIAAMILEPVPANMGVVPPAKDYLKKVREITRRSGALLIFDEVITGFRVSPGGAQKLYGIKPDLTCLGKILGAGLPMAAFGGRAEIMDRLAPAGPVYQAGTLSGNPLAVTAAIWMLGEIKRKRSVLRKLEKKAARFIKQLQGVIAAGGFPVTVNAVSSMFTLFFHRGPVASYEDAVASDAEIYARFFHGCLSRGLYLAPSQFEANFISTEHSDKQLKQTLRIFEDVLTRLYPKKPVTLSI